MNKLTCVAVLASFALSFSPAFAQNTEPFEQGATGIINQSTPSEAVEQDRLNVETLERNRNSPATRGLRPARAFQRRLPSGYGPLVDTAQREEIYRIQAEYYELIALLELRAEMLKRERDTKIEGVLTPNQLDRVRRPARLPLLNR
ncbi:MAG: hypothetical protein FWG73_02975 [Planctomycetaceae bacterium]|nr:hypothetical protein [Planctomycetaceae bacterium]